MLVKLQNLAVHLMLCRIHIKIYKVIFYPGEHVADGFHVEAFP